MVTTRLDFGDSVKNVNWFSCPNNPFISLKSSSKASPSILTSKILVGGELGYYGLAFGMFWVLCECVFSKFHYTCTYHSLDESPHVYYLINITYN